MKDGLTVLQADTVYGTDQQFVAAIAAQEGLKRRVHTFASLRCVILTHIPQ